ncbi:hypothetical protein [Halobaculum marinum]|uniref:Transposase DDE domain-containing protein n=1 Tax=Halobaculum marinum TaxID=3031996 RepID=A0ABD5WTL2_9EURY|nr:hypothetical protein [Halobaculum sp. DT55]
MSNVRPDELDSRLDTGDVPFLLDDEGYDTQTLAGGMSGWRGYQNGTLVHRVRSLLWRVCYREKRYLASALIGLVVAREPPRLGAVASSSATRTYPAATQVRYSSRATSGSSNSYPPPRRAIDNE